jgi:hypothetical protein
MHNIIYSALQTPDGTIIESKYRHDYVTHLDKNGKEYMLDGGRDYLRCTIHGDEKLITIYDDSPFEEIRKYVKWGRNYDADMNLLPKTEWVPICELNDSHLEALCSYERAVKWMRLLFIKEKQYRNLDLEKF